MYFKLIAIFSFLSFIVLNCGGGGGSSSNSYFDGNKSCQEAGINCGTNSGEGGTVNNDIAETTCPSGFTGPSNDCDNDKILRSCDANDFDPSNKNLKVLCDTDQDGFMNSHCMDKDLDRSNTLDETELEPSLRYLCDNCPAQANPDQDYERVVGAACEDVVQCGGFDRDNDSVCNNDDNCPEVANRDQRDEDGDGLGDACDTDGVIYVSGIACGTGNDIEDRDGSFEKPFDSIQVAVDHATNQDGIHTIKVFENYTCDKEKIEITKAINLRGVSCDENDCSQIENLSYISSLNPEELAAINLPTVNITNPRVQGSALNITADARVTGLKLFSNRLTLEENFVVSIRDSSASLENNLIIANDSPALIGNDPAAFPPISNESLSGLPAVTAVFIESSRNNEMHPYLAANKIIVKNRNPNVKATRQVGIHISSRSEVVDYLNPQMINNSIEIEDSRKAAFGIYAKRVDSLSDDLMLINQNLMWEYMRDYGVIINDNTISVRSDSDSYGIYLFKTDASIHSNSITTSMISLRDAAALDENNLRHLTGIHLNSGTLNLDREIEVYITNNLIKSGITGRAELPSSIIIKNDIVSHIFANTLVLGRTREALLNNSRAKNSPAVLFDRTEENHRLISNLFILDGDVNARSIMNSGDAGVNLEESYNTFDSNFHKISSSRDVNIDRTSQSIDLDNLTDRENNYKINLDLNDNPLIASGAQFKSKNPNQERGENFINIEGPQFDRESNPRGLTPDVGCHSITLEEAVGAMAGAAGI